LRNEARSLLRYGKTLYATLYPFLRKEAAEKEASEKEAAKNPMARKFLLCHTSILNHLHFKY
jgi:hypothetical protein